MVQEEGRGLIQQSRLSQANCDLCKSTTIKWRDNRLRGDRPTQIFTRPSVRCPGHIENAVRWRDLLLFALTSGKVKRAVGRYFRLQYVSTSDAFVVLSVSQISLIELAAAWPDQAGRPSVETRVPIRSPAMTRAMFPIFL